MTTVIDPFFTKAREFTDVEIKTLDAWLEAVTLSRRYHGFDVLATRILNDGLLLEHYISLLNADPDERTDQQNEKLIALRNAFEQTLSDFTAKLSEEARNI